MSKIVLSVAEFRTDYPEFSDVSLYPDNVIEAFIKRAGCYISTNNCGILKNDCRKQAIELMVAHLLTLNDKIKSGSSIGGVQTGQLASATIGDVSISLVAPPNKNQFEYWINQTPYGQLYYALLEAKTPAGIFSGSRTTLRVFK